MGRTQEFDTVAVVQAARDVFWDHGFEATSLADLEAATGLRRSSLYHAFESKRGLFDAAVQDYLDTVIRPRLAVLAQADDGRAGLAAYFSGVQHVIATLPDDSPRRGCLLLNSAAGLAAHDDALREVVDGYRAELTAAVSDALARARPDSDAAELAGEARQLTSLSVSALLLARVNRDEAVAILDVAVSQVARW
ncbi:TetR/AcrR family transcriptional regulator [Plantibacter sp. LMC-P-059a]|uniref:TetR/AcrR family transcriptional regulator n=1 Tax=Plantibacter sp. LMC-P-059a TaxID=3040297 RepID=UPI00254F160B|nr:TetR/AcrR family transcriptional regulator [Plantibacter sp. LMC-P-059a]